MSNSFADVQLSTHTRRRSWRLAPGVALTVLAAACSGSQSPTAPTSQASANQSTAAVAAASSSSGMVATEGAQQTGTASFQLADTGGGVFGFVAGSENGVTGRFVTLVGDIQGTNFEPGECVPGIDTTLGFPNRCVGFGTGPGQFVRQHPGDVNDTTCHCTVGGVGDNDTVILKISYPPAAPPQYPFGFTKFTFQDGTGELARLHGQGTLDFASSPQISFTYQFAGQP